MKTYVFVDAEYAYTCAAREGKIPNYKWMFGSFGGSPSDSVIHVYHVGDEIKKKNLCNLLFNLGASYNIVFDCVAASKTQIVAAAMAADVMKCIYNSDADSEWVFVTGDDYLIPIIEELHKGKKKRIRVMYFPLILSRDLERICNDTGVGLETLNNRFLIFSKK